MSLSSAPALLSHGQTSKIEEMRDPEACPSW